MRSVRDARCGISWYFRGSCTQGSPRRRCWRASATGSIGADSGAGRSAGADWMASCWIVSLRQRIHIAALNTRMHRQSPAIHLVSARRRLEAAERALHPLARAKIAEETSRLRNATARLEALSPLAVLGRGYALVYAGDGTLLRDAATTRPGERIRARLARGSVTGEVVRVDPDVMPRARIRLCGAANHCQTG